MQPARLTPFQAGMAMAMAMLKGMEELFKNRHF